MAKKAKRSVAKRAVAKPKRRAGSNIPTVAAPPMTYKAAKAQAVKARAAQKRAARGR